MPIGNGKIKFNLANLVKEAQDQGRFVTILTQLPEIENWYAPRFYVHGIPHSIISATLSDALQFGDPNPIDYSKPLAFIVPELRGSDIITLQHTFPGGNLTVYYLPPYIDAYPLGTTVLCYLYTVDRVAF